MIVEVYIMLLNFLGNFPKDKEIIAIIGPRRPTRNSFLYDTEQHTRDCEVAYQLAQEAARKGIVVLSGLAEGIDTAAHLGCLNEGGITVAVVPFGLNAPVFPKENTQLYKRIIENNGCIVSQFNSEQKAVKWSFVARDKTQAILSEKIIVVGTFPPIGLITGGTKHCANWAQKMGKPLYHYREFKGQYIILKDNDIQIEK